MTMGLLVFDLKQLTYTYVGYDLVPAATNQTFNSYMLFFKTSICCNGITLAIESISISTSQLDLSPHICVNRVNDHMWYI